MNRIETVIYRLVRSNPTLKNAVRNLYQCLFDMLPRKDEYFKNEFDFKEGYYFGFHDLQEVSFDGTKVLANRLSFDLRMPQKGESEQVGYLDLDSDGHLGNFHSLGETLAWNYHKGCRLQWVGNDSVAFNTYSDGRLVSRIADISTGTSREIGFPIDTVSHDSSMATSFSYERLEYCMSGYGYPYPDDSYMDEDHPEKTGLFVIGLNDGTRKLVVPLSTLAGSVPEEYRDGYMHYVTHTEFSPDDRYVSFLHRWRMHTGTDLKRWTRIMVYDRYEDRLIELPSQISGSHYVWNSQNQIVASCVIDGHSCHVLFDFEKSGSRHIIAPSVLNSDGHQSFVSDNMMITDTYPDKYRQSKLYMVDLSTDTVEHIASVFSPKSFQSSPSKGHVACDLHPRVSCDGKYVLFDSCRTGKRGIYIMKLK